MLVAIPLAGFSWAYSSLHAGAYYAAQNVNDVPVIATEDHRLTDPDDADTICENLGEMCHGVIYWQFSDVEAEGIEAADPDEAEDYTISASSTQVIDEFVNEPFAPEEDNPFHLDFMRLATAVTEDPPGYPAWALAVVNSSATAPDGYAVISAKEWAAQADEDTQLFYGPHGDGTGSFIPLAAYALLAICLILSVSALGNRTNLLRFFAPLRILGRSEFGIRSAAFWTVFFPFVGGTVSAIIAGFWYTTVAYITTTGSLGTWLPFMPIGLGVLFAFVFIAVSATTFLPEAKAYRPRNDAEASR
ncbi:hypothetical protein DF222_03035 [Corynebacterium yudongzhengii]|uniref:Uncharacterized protein n=1 Tax=Corynebacterium yudongzhengii TaxID=2080740 RepID=A0A2U1T8L0_9CORY|nr:hypothetical protein DF222_03035 [Corynebacterium yudongzhengii]